MARTGLGNPAFLLRACLESRTVPLACLSRGFQPHASQAVPRAGSPQADRLEACPTRPASLFRQDLRNSAHAALRNGGPRVGRGGAVEGLHRVGFCGLGGRVGAWRTVSKRRG